MKWSLARLVNDRGGRGFVSWELYNEFKSAERGELQSPHRCVRRSLTRLLQRLATSLDPAIFTSSRDLPPRTADYCAHARRLLALLFADLRPARSSSLLSLFSSISAHSAKNGMSPRKLAALFSPYVFGLRDDGSFDETYEEWQRGTTALEHILLSFVRTSHGIAPRSSWHSLYDAGS